MCMATGEERCPTDLGTTRAMDQTEITVSESALVSSQERVRRLTAVLSALGLLIFVAVSIPAAMVGDAVASGPIRYVVMAAVLAAILAPLLVIFTSLSHRRQRALADTMTRFERELTEALDRAESEATIREAQVRRQEFETRLANALEMADGETEVIGVIERAFTATDPGASLELLLADNSHAHLVRMAVSSPLADPPTCPVDSPDHCPAARRAQPQVFRDSEAIDACPKLRDRAGGRCSALCVPVSVMGRTVGVIHTTRDPGVVPEDEVVQDLGTLANLAGARIGLVRMVEETQVQASTDSLTGLLNRRALENAVRSLGEGVGPRSVVMADLDHFKQLNDTHGHETGDRALRAFSQTLAASVRRDDLVGRHGGEEFAVVLPGCSAADAVTVIEKVRVDLRAALAAHSLPVVTASFGVVAALPGEELASALARADAALFQAKHEGRDRVIVHDHGVDAGGSARPTPVVVRTARLASGTPAGAEATAPA
jgi:diguanylate cyclase (GGDEF)-like protein